MIHLRRVSAETSWRSLTGGASAHLAPPAATRPDSVCYWTVSGSVVCAFYFVFKQRRSDRLGGSKTLTRNGINLRGAGCQRRVRVQSLAGRLLACVIPRARHGQIDARPFWRSWISPMIMGALHGEIFVSGYMSNNCVISGRYLDGRYRFVDHAYRRHNGMHYAHSLQLYMGVPHFQ
jgi:hypothetical protein